MIKRLELEAVFFILLGIAVGAVVLHGSRQQPLQFKSDIALPQQPILPSATPTPTPPFVPTSTSTSQISSDGSQKVSLKVTGNQDASKTYEVSTTTPDTFFFRKTLNPPDTITIPFNTWSPDNRYFFLQETTASGPQIMVFTADGHPFANGAAFLDLTAAYAKRAGDTTFDAATGWAANNFIIINTKLADGTQGSSFWYEVPGDDVMQLSTKF